MCVCVSVFVCMCVHVCLCVLGVEVEKLGLIFFQSSYDGLLKRKTFFYFNGDTTVRKKAFTWHNYMAFREVHFQ